MTAIARYLPALLAAALAWLYAVGAQKQRRACFLAGCSTLVAMGLGQLIGMAYPRPRPYDTYPIHLLVPRVHDTSFPSDHAIVGFAVAVGVMMVNRRAGIALLAAALVLCFARVFVGAHYPTDVLAGAALGGLTAAGIWRLGEHGLLRKPLDWLLTSRVACVIPPR
jgi:undecaprenyl-diphosphatase